jgi:hypothetical protein
MPRDSRSSSRYHIQNLPSVPSRFSVGSFSPTIDICRLDSTFASLSRTRGIVRVDLHTAVKDRVEARA